MTVDQSGIKIFHGSVPTNPDVTGDGTLWLSQGDLNAAELSLFSFDERNAGGGQAVAQGQNAYMVVSRRLQRSALFGAADALVLWTDPIAGRQTSFEYAGAGDARHIYTRLQFALDRFDLPVMAFADYQAAFGDAIATSKVCFYLPDDGDGDGLPDAAELSMGTEPNQVDTDGDGRSDGDEVLFDGTDPRGCDDQLQTTNETDVDCGGRCEPCALGQGCAVAADCQTNICTDGACVEIPRCDDERRNGDETDVDCGAQCPPCENNASCLRDTDCQSQLCSDGQCVAQPTCDDGQANGSETDIDCGGADCPPCDLNESCGDGRDCVSTYCESGTCRPAPTCDDDERNGDETDTDCGGPDCDGCIAGLVCTTADDCASGGCVDQRCLPQGTCFDRVRTDTETDVDCGGPCSACSVGQQCRYQRIVTAEVVSRASVQPRRRALTFPKPRRNRHGLWWTKLCRVWLGPRMSRSF